MICYLVQRDRLVPTDRARIETVYHRLPRALHASWLLLCVHGRYNAFAT